jgi:DNA topoisomerase-2
MMTEKTITQFLADEYKEFAMYTIENRAIPSLVDGFKPVQRKIIHISNQLWKSGNEKTKKVFQLAGVVADQAYYHHGNASLENAIITMAQRFKNNAPLLEEDGQFGSLRSPQAGAPRYIGTKLSDNFSLLYKDFELLEYKEEEGELIEPKYFLPIIPTVLLNGSSGIAVGFASNILNRDVKSLVESCQRVLMDKRPGDIKPHLNGFLGDFIQDSENHKKWIIRGKFQRINSSTVKITELPPSMTYEKYEEILDKLVDDKLIVAYDDNCKDNIDYTIKFTRVDLEKLDDDRLIKFLKLEESSTEIYSTLDEWGKLKIFESTEEIIDYFVQFRLKYYTKRKQFILDKLNRELKVLSNRGRFIKAILDGKIVVNNVAKLEIIKQIEKLGLETIDDSYDYLLRMPIYSLTKEMFEKLKEDFVSKKEEIKKMEETDPKDMYLLDLSELKKKFK